MQQLSLDLDMAQLFVPGVRRGYAILPYQARAGESESQLQERLRGAIIRVREANVLTGAVGPMGQKREAQERCLGGEAEAHHLGSRWNQVQHRGRVCDGEPLVPRPLSVRRGDIAPRGMYPCWMWMG